jgi:HlyD family secretion protein
VKLVITIGVSVLIAVAGLAAVGMKYRDRFMAAPPATPVRVETATSGSLVEIVSAPGEIQPFVKVSISARVVAPIVAIPFDEGATVTKGKQPDGSDASVLVNLDDKNYVAALNSAKSRRDAQKSQIDVADARLGASRAQIAAQKFMVTDAERDLRRQVGLLGTKDVSQSIVDSAQTKVDNLKAMVDSADAQLKSDEANLVVMQHQLKAAEADVARAEDDLTYCTIKSPIDGVVTRRKAEVGEMVVTGTMNNAGTVILEVADLSQMMMFARIDETSIANVKVGQHAKVRIQAFPDEIFDGTVETVALARNDDSSSMGRSSSAEGSTRYFEAKIRLKTEGRRIPSGLASDADIETKSHHGVRVPSQSVLGRPTDGLSADARSKPEVDPSKSIATVVYRYLDGKAVATPVKVGPSDETHTLILSGLKEGDPVIVGPYKILETLADGQQLQKEAPPTTRPTTQPAAKTTS